MGADSRFEGCDQQADLFGERHAYLSKHLVAGSVVELVEDCPVNPFRR
ncbi:MAG: hypothetical protein P8Q36_05105 [Alphaproteobacteria bacterium]|nr:hypothetical protein [Rhodospirillaceae bacterium]MDG2480235.1 hypothetical protein [Alphaproteobacteria bacterium]